MSSLFEARLLVQLADHVQRNRGLARLTAGNTVAQAEVALSHAQAQDVSPQAADMLNRAVAEWAKGKQPAPYMLNAFWTAHMVHQKLRPAKFRMHVGAPACFQTDGGSAFFLAVNSSKQMHPGGNLEQMALGEFRGEQGRFPDDVTLWWEGDLTAAQITELARYVQPGCTLTLMRPDPKSWWLGWAGIKFDDKLPTLLYSQFNFNKVFAVKEDGCDIMIIGVEGVKK